MGSGDAIFGAAGSGGGQGALYFTSSSLTLREYAVETGSETFSVITSAVYRDPSAWYHIVAVFDTTQATSSNRIKLYVNGSQVTALSTASYPSLNFEAYNINNSSKRALIGTQNFSGSGTMNGYQTEVNFIDGQALTPSDFGLTNPQTGQWIPKKYTGTYGTNGFYLNFKDATSTTTLGYDYSGNANNWTTNNFSVTAGAGNDSLTDVPTPWFAYNTTGDVGGVFRGNYCTLNPIGSSATLALVNGNLDIPNNQNNKANQGTIGVSSGKWYWEVTVNADSKPCPYLGVTFRSQENDPDASPALSNTVGRSVIRLANNYLYKDYTSTGGIATGGTAQGTNGVVGISLNFDTGEIKYYNNNTLFHTDSTIPTNGTILFPYVGLTNSGGAGWNSAAFNFGQRPFAYTPPSGFLSLCTTNLPASTILKGSEYMNAVTYAGSASQQTINSNLSILDFAWIKNLTAARDHIVVDTVRGGSPMLTLYPSFTYADDNTSPNYNPTSISGSSIVLGGAKLGINNSGENFVLWGWNAGGSTVTNTSGTISAQVRASTTSGFSIVTYTGTGANATVGHGLGAVPRMIILKGRDTAYNWRVYHASLGNTGGVFLNTTAAFTSTSGYWNDTTPTSTVFTIGTDLGMNQSAATYVAYCFAPISGFSAFGSYTGNGSTDGPFVYLGFRPRFILIKRSSDVDDWFMYDTARSPYNPMNFVLSPNSSAADTATTNPDNLSNGFKLRSTSGGTNASGSTYIYMAFAENPFKNALAR
jgi:hypothetical protein